MVVNNVHIDDEGVYHTVIDNDIIADLTLVTHTFRIVVRDSLNCDIPPAGMSCETAPIFCNITEYDFYCGTTKTFIDTSLCQEFELLNEGSWLGFVADSGDIEIQILPYSCSGPEAGIQAAIFHNCAGKQLVLCEPECSKEEVTFSLTDPIPGDEYYLYVKSCGGNCKYQIRGFSTGKPLDLELNGGISGPDSVCSISEVQKYAVEDAPGSAHTYKWIVKGDTLETSTEEFQLSWQATGTYTLCVYAISNCGTSNTICKRINVFPGFDVKDFKIEILPNDSFYILSFAIEGGAGTITIDGLTGVFNAIERTFVSDPIPCGDRYEFSVFDRNGCTREFDGKVACNCTSEAGNIPTELISTCEGIEIHIGPANSFVPDSNDVATFVVLDQQQYDPDHVITENPLGIFSSDHTAIELGRVYYAMHIVGDEKNGSIDLYDPCLDVSNFRPFIFIELPQSEAGSDTFHCAWKFNLRAIKSSPQTQGEWSLLSGPGSVSIADPGAALTSVNVDMIGFYQFAWREYTQNCEDIDTVEIEIRNELLVTFTGHDSLCSDDQDTIFVNENFLTYQWENGTSGSYLVVTGPGEYCVVVTHQDGCVQRKCITVEETVTRAPEIMGENRLCSGDELTLQVVPVYRNYRWSTGDTTFHISIDTGGLFCITVTDYNGCRSSDCSVIQYHEAATSNISDTICYGDSVVIDGNVFNSGGSFQVKIEDPTNSKCDSIVNLNLTVLPEIYISDSLVQKDDGSGNGSVSVAISGGKPPYDYLWNTGATLPFINMLVADIYTLVVTDKNNCKQEFVFDLRNATSVDDKTRPAFSIIPNPANAGKEIYISSADFISSIDYQWLSLDGQIIDRGYLPSINSGFIPIPLDFEGVYLLKLSDEDGTWTYTERLVITK